MVERLPPMAWPILNRFPPYPSAFGRRFGGLKEE